MREIYVYSDGGSINNGKKDPTKPSYGAYCTLIVNKNNQIQRTFCEMFEDMTNNQMELYGGIKGLRFLSEYFKKYCPNEKVKVYVCSDSQYLIKGCSEWIHGWKKKGWKNSAKKTVENLHMWKEMDLLLQNPQFQLEFVWVKGHKGKTVLLEQDRNVYFNEICDTELSKLLDMKRGEL